MYRSPVIRTNREPAFRMYGAPVIRIYPTPVVRPCGTEACHSYRSSAISVSNVSSRQEGKEGTTPLPTG